MAMRRATSVPADQRPGAEVEVIVHAGLDDMDLAVEVAAEVHHVVLDLGGPVVPQRILGADAEHPSADRLVAEDPGADAVHAGESVEAHMGPGAAKLAVDEPAIEGPAGTRRERGDPVETRIRARGSESTPGNEEDP